MAWKNEAEAREQIKAMVAEYYHDFKEKKTPYQEGDRITYAANLPSGSALSSPIWSTAVPPPT